MATLVPWSKAGLSCRRVSESESFDLEYVIEYPAAISDPQFLRGAMGKHIDTATVVVTFSPSRPPSAVWWMVRSHIGRGGWILVREQADIDRQRCSVCKAVLSVDDVVVGFRWQCKPPDPDRPYAPTVLEECEVAMGDPLVPAEHRWPRAKAQMPLCDELPSAARPFLMLGGVIAAPTQAKHRTNAHPTNHTQSTTMDGKTRRINQLRHRDAVIAQQQRDRQIDEIWQHLHQPRLHGQP